MGCPEMKDWDALDVFVLIFMIEVVVGLGFWLWKVLTEAMK